MNITSSPISTDPLHDVTSAAVYLRCGPRLIYRLVNERRIHFTKAGRCLRFRQSDLDRYLETNAVEPTSKAS